MGMINLSADASTTPPVALSIAGSDSGGSAGVAADLKSFAANGVHGVFALTLVTAQNTTGIVSAEPVTDTMIGAQIDAVTADFDIGATKTGMLFSEHAIGVVADRAASLTPLVVDPVLVSSAGTPLFEPTVAEAYVQRLFPMAALITPNVAEAALLSGQAIADRAGVVRAAQQLLDLGPHAVLVTGFHDGDHAVDVFASADEVVELDHELVDTANVLGTGCSLSATITARLAAGDNLTSAIDRARAYVLAGLRGSAAWRLGEGRGPIDHLAGWPDLR